MYAAYGDDTIAIRAALQRKYGDLATILVIIRVVLFLIDLWKKLKIEEPTEVPSAAELEYAEFTDDDENDR